MTSFTSISFYIPKETILHRLNIFAKLAIFAFYLIAIFRFEDILPIFLLYILLNGFAIMLQLPLRNKTVIGSVILLLLIVMLTNSINSVIGRSILAIGKLMCLSMLVSLFTMTTKLHSVFEYFTLRAQSRNTKASSELFYVLSTTIAVIPSIQFDLHRAIDSETLRRGKRVGILAIDSWVSILIVTIVRTLNRTERFTDTVIDRGFDPSRGLQVLTNPSFNISDLLVSLGLIIPAVLIWIVSL